MFYFFPGLICSESLILPYTTARHLSSITVWLSSSTGSDNFQKVCEQREVQRDRLYQTVELTQWEKLYFRRATWAKFFSQSQLSWSQIHHQLMLSALAAGKSLHTECSTEAAPAFRLISSFASCFAYTPVTPACWYSHQASPISCHTLPAQPARSLSAPQPFPFATLCSLCSYIIVVTDEIAVALPGAS